MPIYHCSKSEVQRSKGANAVASSAYISRSKLAYITVDKETGEVITTTFDYSNKEGLSHSEILAPDYAPDWVFDREELWNRCESVERRKDAETARKLIIALPKELTLEQNIELARDFAQECLVVHGMIADVNIHYDNEGNPHCHIQMTTRVLKELESGEITFGLKNLDWGRRDFLYYYRESVANVINKHLELHGHLERVSHLSHKDRGFDLEPTIHEGPARHIGAAELRIVNQQIVKSNAAKIRENPEVVFDKLSINKPVFTKEDIAKVLSDALYADLKFAGGNNKSESQTNLIEDLNKEFQKEFLALYHKVLASDKISVVVEEDLKGRTLYALTKRLELEKRFEDTVHGLWQSKKHCLNVYDKDLEVLSIREVFTHEIRKVGDKVNRSLKNATGIDLLDFVGVSLKDKDDKLNEEQREAIIDILNGADISILEGMPGTGKTLAMKEIVRQYKKGGFNVIGAAVSSAAALNLASVAGIEARNITKWRQLWQDKLNISRSKTWNGKDRKNIAGIGKVGRAGGVSIKGRTHKFELGLRADYYKEEQYQGDRSELSSNDVLIIDEASQVELANMDYMLSRAKKAGAKVILVGDTNQFAAVGMSGALKKAVEVVGSNKLVNVQRQYSDEEKRATVLLGEYKVKEALEIYEREGCFTICNSANETRDKLLEDYVDSYIERSKLLGKDNLASMKSVAICTFTNDAANKFNNLVREKLKLAGIIKVEFKGRDNGALSGEVGEDTKNQRKNFRINNKSMELCVGEQIVFEANNYRHGILNGEVGTIVKLGSISELGYGKLKILVHKADGSKKVIELDTEGRPRDRAVKFDYGYAVTAYKLQGASVDHVLVHYSPEVGYEAFNVMMTRHRERVTLYANKEELENQVYSRLDLDHKVARSKFEINTNEELWKVGLFISVSRRVNESFASDYVNMGETGDDLVLKSYIESQSIVVKYLREIEEWQQRQERRTSLKPTMWEHEAWEKVSYYKNLRDSDAKFIVDNYDRFKSRIKQLELNYASILKHSGKSDFSYKVESRADENSVASNPAYGELTRLVNELNTLVGTNESSKQFILKEPYLVSTSLGSNSSLPQVRNINTHNIKNVINSIIDKINRTHKQLDGEIRENKASIELLKEEANKLNDYEQLLKEKVASTLEYEYKLLPEFLRRIYIEPPEKILQNWEELKKEVGLSVALEKVTKKPEILGKLPGFGIGSIQGFEPRRINAIVDSYNLPGSLTMLEEGRIDRTGSEELLSDEALGIRKAKIEQEINALETQMPTNLEAKYLEVVSKISKIKEEEYTSIQHILSNEVVEEAALSYKYKACVRLGKEKSMLKDKSTLRNNDDVAASKATDNSWTKKCEQIIDVSKTSSKKYASKYRRSRSSISTNNDSTKTRNNNKEIPVTFAEVSAHLSSSHYEQLFRQYANLINTDGKIKKQGRNISCGSLTMNLSSGLWIRFSTNEGGDIYHFVEKALGVDKKGALEHIADLYGISGSRRVREALDNRGAINTVNNNGVHNNSIHSNGKDISDHRISGKSQDGETHKTPEWVPMEVIPETAGTLNKHSELIKNLSRDNEIVDIYYYRNIRGELIGATIRCIDKETGKKQILPASYCKLVCDYNELKEETTWRLKGFTDKGYKPIYGAEKLKEEANQYKPVLIVEGEKTAKAASLLLPEYTVVSWLGGTASADKVNWSLLKGKEVVIWPDLDAPGIKAAKTIAQSINLANEHCGMVTQIDPEKLEFNGGVHENLFPEKWDLADELPAEISVSEVREAIDNARANTRVNTRSLKKAKDLSSLSNNNTNTAAVANIAERILLQEKSYGMDVDTSEVIEKASREAKFEKWLNSNEVATYTKYVETKEGRGGQHEFLAINSALYKGMLISCISDIENTELEKLLNDATDTKGEYYVRANATRVLLAHLDDNYQAKAKIASANVNIEQFGHSKQYEESLASSNEQLELYKVLVRDIALLHQEQFGHSLLWHNLSEYHHKKIARDVYNELISAVNTVSMQSNSQSFQYNSQYKLTDQDKIIIADKVFESLNKSEWWKDLTSEQLDIAKDKVTKLEDKRKEIELSEFNLLHAKVKELMSDLKVSEFIKKQELTGQKLSEELVTRTIERHIAEVWLNNKHGTKQPNAQTLEIGEINAIIARSLYECINVSKEENRLYAQYKEHNDEPMTAEERLDAITAAQSIVKYKGYYVEKNVLITENSKIEFHKIELPKIEAIENYKEITEFSEQTLAKEKDILEVRDAKIKEIYNNNETVIELAKLDPWIGMSLAEQIADHEYYYGTDTIPPERFDIMNKVAHEEGLLHTKIMDQFKQESFNSDELISSYRHDNDCDAGVNLACQRYREERTHDLLIEHCASSDKTMTLEEDEHIRLHDHEHLIDHAISLTRTLQNKYRMDLEEHLDKADKDKDLDQDL